MRLIQHNHYRLVSCMAVILKWGGKLGRYRQGANILVKGAERVLTNLWVDI